MPLAPQPLRAAAFWRAFFCRRGSRVLFLGCSFGIFTFGGEGAFGSGDAAPTRAATLPAAEPIAFAALTSGPSSASGSVFFFFFSCFSAICPLLRRRIQ